MKGEYKIVNIKIDKDLWTETRVAAIRKGMSVREFVEETLRETIKKSRGK